MKDAMMERKLARLKELTAGCREDMHEPDNQKLTAVVHGTHLDNAMGDDPMRNCNELTVGFQREVDGVIKTEWMNLADIIALARLAK